MNTTENTPEHCHGCHQLTDCRQAQNMTADTEPVEGFVYDGEVYCADCLGYHEAGTPYYGESDTPTHCGGCGVPIIHELTVEGAEYVRDSLADGGGCCAELWPVIWEGYDIQPRIPIDSIEVPGRFVELCEGWAGNIDCMLRAVSSTGGLTLGRIRPVGCDTNEKWYLTLWRNLAADVYHTRCAACIKHVFPEGDPEIAKLVGFELWVDEQVARLEESYGLEEWDAVD
jgi:hypothetical protein